MKLKLSHIAIASPSMQMIEEKLRNLGIEKESEHAVESEKVVAGFFPVEVSTHFRLESVVPTSAESTIAKYLLDRPRGGIHHLSFEVSHLEKWQKILIEKGMTVLPPGIRIAARGRALFIHPKDMCGVLVELEELV